MCLFLALFFILCASYMKAMTCYGMFSGTTEMYTAIGRRQKQCGLCMHIRWVNSAIAEHPVCAILKYTTVSVRTVSQKC